MEALAGILEAIYATTYVVLVVLSAVLGYHIYSSTKMTEEYAKTGRIRVRLWTTASLAIVHLFISAGLGSTNPKLTPNDWAYWTNIIIPWFISSIVVLGFWISTLRHIYQVVRVEEAEILTKIDQALQVKFPIDAKQIQTVANNVRVIEESKIFN